MTTLHRMTRIALTTMLAAATMPGAAQAQMEVPFDVGERLQYEVRFGPLRVGQGTMEVVGVDTVRGHDVWATEFRIKGGTFFYRVNDVLRSWIDRDTFSSLRHEQDYEEGGRDRERLWEIYPDRQVYVQVGRSGDGPDVEEPSVSNPLDDGSFLYFIRTVPLEVGETYEFDRYFRPDRNPVTIKVLRKERLKVPAGEFDAVVIQPIIKTSGIFSENGRAEIWLSDDHRRIMLQMKSKLSFGSLNLYLKSFHPGTPATTTSTP